MMSRTARTVLLMACGLVAVAVGAVAWYSLGSANVLKPRAETVLSSALDMDADIRGDLRLRLLPTPEITLEEVHLYDERGNAGVIDRLRVGVSPVAWLRGKPPLRTVRLYRPELTVNRAHGDGFGMARSNAGSQTVALTHVAVRDARLWFGDPDEGGLEAQGCDVTVERLVIAGDPDLPLTRRLTLDAQFACDRLGRDAVTVEALRGRLAASDGVFEFDPVSLRLFGGDGAGNAIADFSTDDARHRVEFGLAQFPIEAFLALHSPENTVDGTMTFVAELSSRGADRDEILRNLSGELSLDGESLTLHGFDLDDEISDYESTQAFDLVDAGAFFLAGPVGLMATQGRDFAGILAGPGDTQTPISLVLSAWRVDNGSMRAVDVALRTPRNRIALQGSLDLVEARYEDVTVAVVDDEGCAMVEQDIRGPFDDPEVQSPNVLATAAAPVFDLVERVAELFNGDDGCDEVFYVGAVSPPEG